MKAAAVISLLSSAAGVLAERAPEVHSRAAAKAHFGGPISKDRHAEFAANGVQSPWGGSVQEGRGWRTVTGTTVIPEVDGQDPHAGAAAWVGIDGKSLQSSPTR